MTPDDFLFKLQNLPPDTVLTATHLAALLEVLKPATLHAQASVVEGNYDTYPNSKIISEDEVGDWIGESTSTLQKWRVSGKGPKFIKKPKNVGYRVGDVKEWLDTLTVSSTAESHVRLNRLETVFSSPLPYFVPVGGLTALSFFDSLGLDDDDIEEVIFEYVEHYDDPKQNIAAWLFNRLPMEQMADLLPKLEEYIANGADLNQKAKRIFGQEVIEFDTAELMANYQGSDTWYNEFLTTLLDNGMDVSKIEHGCPAYERVMSNRNLNNRLQNVVPNKPEKRRHRDGIL
jgi:hypothetical protein